MLARTPPWSPWAPRSEAAEAALAAEVEAIKADCRARRAQLAADRASFWERVMNDETFDAKRARQDGEPWVEGEPW